MGQPIPACLHRRNLLKEEPPVEKSNSSGEVDGSEVSYVGRSACKLPAIIYASRIKTDNCYQGACDKPMGQFVSSAEDSNKALEFS